MQQRIREALPEELRKDFEYLTRRMMCAEEDRDASDAKLAGQWPGWEWITDARVAAEGRVETSPKETLPFVKAARKQRAALDSAEQEQKRLCESIGELEAAQGREYDRWKRAGLDSREEDVAWAKFADLSASLLSERRELAALSMQY